MVKCPAVPILFMSQTQLEEWALSEKADLREGHLVVPGASQPFVVVNAVHFAKVVTGTDDQKLLNKVKTEAELQKLGGEQMSDSVILGETAYEVVTGYLLETGEAGEPAAAARSPGGKATTTETSLLADFLLGKLS